MSAQISFTTAVTRGRAAVAAQTKSSWTLGDIARTVKPTYGDDTMGKLADAIGVELPTLRNFRTVAEAYAAGDRTDNSFTVHAVFASQADRVDLVHAKTWTVSDARALVASRNAPAPADSDETDSDETNGNGPADELEIARAEVLRLQGELAKAMAKVAKIEAERGITQTTDAPAKPVKHMVRGIPQHTTANPNAACTQCQLAGLVPQPTNAADLVPVNGRRNRRAA